MTDVAYAHFIDGPAEGTNLTLQRTPIYLRAVHSADRGWDALDLLDDEVRDDETIHIYLLAAEPTRGHMSCRPRSSSHWFSNAQYRQLQRQPGAEHTRNNEAWAAWCKRPVRGTPWPEIKITPVGGPQ